MSHNLSQDKLEAPGALLLENTKGTIDGVMFDSNVSNFRGGAVYISTKSDITFSNLDAYENESKSGGFMYVDNSHVVVTASYIFNNYAVRRGGFAYITNKADVEIFKGNIEYNSSDISGGAIYIEGKSLAKIDETTLLNITLTMQKLDLVHHQKHLVVYSILIMDQQQL